MTSALPTNPTKPPAVADRFSDDGQVRSHATDCLVPAEMDPEAGLDLVEQQQRSAKRAERAQLLEKARNRRHGAVSADMGFAHNCCDLGTVVGKDRPHRYDIVPFDNDLAGCQCRVALGRTCCAVRGASAVVYVWGRGCEIAD